MKWFCFYILLIATIFANAEEALVVELATEGERLPLYATSLADGKSGFDGSYCRQLEAILRSDLDNGGKVQLLPITSHLNQLAATAPFAIEQWRDHSLDYFVKSQLVDQQLTATLVSIRGNWVKKVGPVALGGDLVSDRQRIHEVADALHTALFGVRGIATTRILYTIRHPLAEGGWSADVWEIDYDGSNNRQLLKGAGYCVTPQYAPAARGCRPGSFFYVSYMTGQPKIYMAHIKGGEPQRLTTLRGNQLMPTLSRQRDKVAFISDVTGNPDLFIQSFSPECGPIGKPQQLFTAGLATQGTPTFSPDGKQVAFVSNKDGSPRIYVIESTPPSSGVGKATLITKFRRGCTAPAWSPDGNKIAYCARIDGVRQIFVHDLTSGEEKQLTQGAGNKENPTWAPNSLHLVYNQSNGSSSDLYTINLNQPKPIQLTHGPGEKRFPHWEP